MTPADTRIVQVLLSSLPALAACGRGAPKPPPPDSAPAQSIAAATRPPRAGFDSVGTRHLQGATCYVGERYVVVARDLANQEGADLVVRPRGAADTEPSCAADSVAGDIVFRTGDAAGRHPDAQYFLGLKGPLLLAGDGTGARTDLYIYDLEKRAKVMEVDGVDDNELAWPGPATLAVWVTKAYDKAAVAAGCPDSVPANPPQLDSLMSLDLAALSLRPTGRFRCGVGQ